MRILLTGGRGMVGHNIIEHVAHDKNIELIAPSSEALNLLNAGQVVEYVKQCRPDMVIHAAGIVGGIQANISNPVKFLVENLEMGKNLVLAARDAGVTRLLNFGSTCMYPRNAPNPLKEEMILQGELEPTNEGYAIAKITVARLCEYIQKENASYQYKTLIPCNLYGKYDKFDPRHSHMIPAVIRKIHEAKVKNETTVEIWGDGMARREFMYAEDLASFTYFAVRNFELLPPKMNVGLGHDYTINEYYQAIAEVVGYTGKFHHDLDKPVGMKQKLCDVSWQKKLGVIPKYDLKSGIQETYNYFLKEHLS